MPEDEDEDEDGVFLVVIASCEGAAGWVLGANSRFAHSLVAHSHFVNVELGVGIWRCA